VQSELPLSGKRLQHYGFRDRSIVYCVNLNRLFFNLQTISDITAQFNIKEFVSQSMFQFCVVIETMRII